ncbi:DUF554 domain-containing protein [Mobilicoccus pelagius]|nr:DUF554 domain-containing protein [Mobilicoccus pelagius]
MDASIPGLGTLVNTVAVAAGALLGMGAGHRFSERTRTIVTDCLGLVTLLMAALSAMSVTSPALAADVGASAPVLIVLGSLVLGGVVGSALRIEDRLEGLAGTVRDAVAARLRRRRTATGSAATTTAPRARTTGMTAAGATAAQPVDRATPPVADDTAVDTADDTDDGTAAEARERFIEGWLTATLLFCVGPLTILGSINDGLGRGIDQLAVKSALDFFASIAFASTFGVGVLASAVSVLVVQGGLTLVGMLLGAVMPESQIMALTATGGLLLVGIAFRLLDVKHIRVGDLLPALVVAPLLTAAVAAFH